MNILTPVSVIRWLPKFPPDCQSVCQMPPEWDFFHRATPVVAQIFTGHRIGQSVGQMPPEWDFFHRATPVVGQKFTGHWVSRMLAEKELAISFADL